MSIVHKPTTGSTAVCQNVHNSGASVSILIASDILTTYVKEGAIHLEKSLKTFLLKMSWRSTTQMIRLVSWSPGAFGVTIAKARRWEYYSLPFLRPLLTKKLLNPKDGLCRFKYLSIVFLCTCSSTHLRATVTSYPCKVCIDPSGERHKLSDRIERLVEKLHSPKTCTLKVY